MKKIFTLLLLFSFQLSKAQRYTQGVPFDTTILAGYYSVIQGCSQSPEINIQLDPSLFNYVSGLQFMLIRDSVQYPMPGGNHTVILEDTTILDSTNPVFSAFSSGATTWFRIKLAGTPAQAGQTYPCRLAWSQCTCFCFNAAIIPEPGSPTCTVDLPNKVAELDRPENPIVFPNPAVNTLSVKGMSAKTSLQLHDAFGKLVMEQQTGGDSQLNVAGLTEGVYTLSIDNGKTKTFNKILIAR